MIASQAMPPVTAAQPTSTGTAPAAPPDRDVLGRRALEPHRVHEDVEGDRREGERGGEHVHREREERERDGPPNANPKRSALLRLDRVLGSGRCRVRRITWSMSRSRYMLHALAEAAASVPPIRVASTSQAPGSCRRRRIMGGTVVISSRTMTWA